jgi:4-hydroxy-3-polyprenylbenzoate decarboxylase
MPVTANSTPPAVAITGASGTLYALRRLLEVLRQNGQAVDLLILTPGQIVLGMESGLKLPGRTAEIKRVLTQHYGAAQDQL